jgi:hypothetical protein
MPAAYLNDLSDAINDHADDLDALIAASAPITTQTISATGGSITPDAENGHTLVITHPNPGGPPSVSTHLLSVPANLIAGDVIRVVIVNQSAAGADIDWQTGWTDTSGTQLTTQTVAAGATAVRQFIAISTTVLREL